jgi:DNA-directed RNA polymerase
MLAKVLNLANKYRGEPMYFVAQLDWRSRCYATSFHLHPQGPDYVRGLLMFGEGKPLTTPEAVRWFKIHGANCHGETKSSFDERVAWVDKMDPVICQIADDPYTHQQWQSADDPWQFLGWCREYAAWKEQGEAFESRVPVALDATQSGLQVLSMLLRDPVGASATNCVPSERPQDLYQRIADQVNDLLRAEDSEVSRMWLTFGVDRTTVKRIAMTRVYNSQLYSAMGYVREWAIERVGSEEALPTENDYSACLYLARQIWTAMDSVIAGAQQAMDWFGKVADICVANEISIRWTTPIGYTVKQDYRKYRSRSVKTRIGDEIRQHKLREDTEKFDSMKMRNALAPNVVHSLDASLMYLTANLVSSRGVGSLAVVHDSFATHAADTEVLAQSIRESAADMFTEDLLAEFKHEVETLLPAGVVLPELPPYGSLDPGAVRDSHYFFN